MAFWTSEAAEIVKNTPCHWAGRDFEPIWLGMHCQTNKRHSLNHSGKRFRFILEELICLNKAALGTPQHSFEAPA